MWNKFKMIGFAVALLGCWNIGVAQSQLPQPAHVVVLIMENHGYTQIIKSPAAPYINMLVNDTSSAVFHQFYAQQHPSQPNYLDLFAGCNQGVNDNNVPQQHPFSTPNLGRQLIDAGYTFATYSEDLPEIGFNGEASGDYARKHNPASNWMGSGENQISPETNQPFTSFPLDDFNWLPTISFVIPNQENDMHNGSDPDRIVVGDQWIEDHLKSYIEWAKTHNSLFILTFDEDNSAENNRIPTVIVGEQVKPGGYNQYVNHYNLLRTLEEMYSLPYACKAADATAITDCWKDKNNIASVNDHLPISILPNPSKGSIQLTISSFEETTPITYQIISTTGSIVRAGKLDMEEGNIAETIMLVPGIYIVRLTEGGKVDTRRVVVQ